MGRINDEWQDFITATLNNQTITKTQYQEMRKTFFYAFARLLRILTLESQNLSDDEVNEIVEKMMIEANEFVRELKVEAEMMEREKGAGNVQNFFTVFNNVLQVF